MKKLANQVQTANGLQVRRFFTRENAHPFDDVQWEARTAEIKDWKSGKVSFRQEDLEFPSSWSQRATDIVASKYFRGHVGTSGREKSVRQLISRIANTITDWGRKMEYFASATDAVTFNHELTHLMLHQMAAFNSPVQFNVGIKKNPQCSACFINSVEDSMDSIMKLAKTEAMIFKGGSGSGVNLSRIRSSSEMLSVGGLASGPVSFMRGYDSFAGAIKSGGATRRAAKMVILNADHPDIKEYIWCKAAEEKKAQQLIELGYDDSIDGEAYRSVQFQNANNSVSVTDEFMNAVLRDDEWQTRKVTTDEVSGSYKAKEMLKWVADATWICGDPGLQFSSTINDWHTCPESGPISACNPCSEYVFLDNSACNLSSLNLMKFMKEDGQFDIEGFKQAVRIMILAQEIIVDNSSYPTAEITKNSHDYRTLGLGFANLGAFLMARGLPYDSDRARTVAAGITALMTGEAYLTSAEIAEKKGPFPGYEKNRLPMARVMHKHRDALSRLDSALVPLDILHGAIEAWDQAILKGTDQRLPKRAGHTPRAHRHDRFYDGLRHDGHRAGILAREDQEAGRRRDAQDHQQHDSAGAPPVGLLRGADPGDQQIRGIRGDHRGCASLEGRASARLRLCGSDGPRDSSHPLPWPYQDVRRRSAVPFRSDFQDHQPAERGVGRGHHGSLRPGLALRDEVGFNLS